MLLSLEVVKSAELRVDVGNVFVILSAVAIQAVDWYVVGEGVEWFRFGIPAVIEATDEIPSRSVRIMRRQKVQVSHEWLWHLLQLTLCPVDCVFEEEDEIVAAG